MTWSVGNRSAWATALVVGLVVILLGALGPSTAPARAAARPVDATAASDFSGDGRADVVAPTADGVLWLYRGDGVGGFSGARSRLGTGWGSRDQIRMVGDWDGVAGTDVVARNPGTGALWLYPGNGSGGFGPARTIGSGWQVFSQIFSPGDWDGDGHNDLLAILSSDGSMRMYRGNGSGGWVAPYPTIGTGWNSIRFPGEGRVTTGSTCTNPYFTTSSSNGGVTDGGYYVHNNLWNAGSYPGTKGTTSVCSYHSWNHVATAANTGDGAVKTYPNVHKDYSGRKISSFTTLTSRFSAVAPPVGIYNVAYDLWINGVPNDEVMIWTDNRNQYPAGSRFASGVSLGGYTWDVYATSGNGYIAFVPSNGARHPSGTIDIKAMLSYLVSTGRRSASDTVDQIGYGVEIVSTGGSPATWNFTDFSITDS